MRLRALSTIGAFGLFLCGSGAASAISRTTEVLCPFSGTIFNADNFSRGIYVTNYPGNNLATILLAYVASDPNAGFYAITLTAHRGAFNGPIIGTSQIAVANVGNLAGGIPTIVTFDFGGAPVSQFDTIAFTQSFEQLSGTAGGQLYFNNGPGGSSCPGVVQTEDTKPPLSHPNTANPTAAIRIDEVNLSSSCIPSDNVMCVDNNPGDQRFKVTVSFHTSQGGGISGTGQEIPLAPLGVIHGGVFWFFGADNPEMLFKMVNGCALNNHFWVFISAGTNVGFTVTVMDTANGHTKSYTNPDLTAALPVQDTSALPCP